MVAVGDVTECGHGQVSLVNGGQSINIAPSPACLSHIDSTEQVQEEPLCLCVMGS